MTQCKNTGSFTMYKELARSKRIDVSRHRGGLGADQLKASWTFSLPTHKGNFWDDLGARIKIKCLPRSIISPPIKPGIEELAFIVDWFLCCAWLWKCRCHQFWKAVRKSGQLGRGFSWKNLAFCRPYAPANLGLLSTLRQCLHVTFIPSSSFFFHQRLELSSSPHSCSIQLAAMEEPLPFSNLAPV